MVRATHLALVALVATNLAAGAGDAPPPAPASSESPWNTSTAPPPPRPPAEDSTLSLRLYSGGDGRDKLPYRSAPPRRDDPAWAVDVSAVMTRCPDGNLVITALVIGGQLTPLDNRCAGDRAQNPQTTPGQAPPCDANTWNCRTKPAP